MNTAIKKIRELLGDSAEQPRYVETIPRRGYRFVAPVTTSPSIENTATVCSQGPQPAPPTPLAEATKWRRAARPAAYAVVGVFAAAILLVSVDIDGWRARLLGHSAVPHVESLAVLPPANLSGDPDQDYFADGMTEALIANLAQVRALRVISRTSAMHYKGTTETLPCARPER